MKSAHLFRGVYDYRGCVQCALYYIWLQKSLVSDLFAELCKSFASSNNRKAIIFNNTCTVGLYMKIFFKILFKIFTNQSMLMNDCHHCVCSYKYLARLLSTGRSFMRKRQYIYTYMYTFCSPHNIVYDKLWRKPSKLMTMGEFTMCGIRALTHPRRNTEKHWTYIEKRFGMLQYLCLTRLMVMLADALLRYTASILCVSRRM